ncbi:Glycine receptor subunit alphaZ1 [Aphelenchoides besseyi]|nr:Glycine receptor subunit alphaZ1 [Aphelenchoides besseyi]
MLTIRFVLLFAVLFQFDSAVAKRKSSGSNRRGWGDEREGMGAVGSQWELQDENDKSVDELPTQQLAPENEKEQLKKNSIAEPTERNLQDVVSTTTIAQTEPPTTTEFPKQFRDDIATIPTNIADNNENLTILWIDATFKAEDYGMNVSRLIECLPWLEYWADSKNLTSSNTTIEKDEDFEMPERKEFEVIDDSDRLEELGLDQYLLDEYESIGVLYKEICGNHPRQIWYSTPEQAKEIGLNEKSPICDPFKVQLQPDAETLTQLALQLNEMILNSTKPGFIHEIEATTVSAPTQDNTDGQVVEMLDWMHTPEPQIPQRVLLRLRRAASCKFPNVTALKPVSVVAAKSDSADTTDAPAIEEINDQDWLEDIRVESREILSVSKQLVDRLESENVSVNSMEMAWIQIDATDETNPLLYVLSAKAAESLRLKIPKHNFNRYEKVVLHLPGVCADYVPTAIDAFNASDFEGIEIEGPIGVNITALELAGVNLTELAETLRNDTEVDEILGRTYGTTRTLGGSYIIPVLQKNQYDAFSAPIVFQGSAVVVRFGIYIESMSNFQTSTMDYDMDIYLIMAWRDARLVNPYGKPILVKEEDILERIWRPDPFFANAKEAEFHEVTFLNFLMRIFSDGIVLYETRIKLKPACNLVLCKYPHDKQVCELLIKSFAYPVETVRFEWFTRKIDAIDKNPDVKLPELYIDRYEPTTCNKTRKSGEFSCLRALFRLKRDVGFHIAQTYIPTSLALMFSWVGVWLPHQFNEGRIGVAITVLLTLSTESAGAREHLPSVSYLKAIDLWFGFITGFVFFTLLQTLFVIGFDKRSTQLRKNANKKRSDLTQEYKDALVNKADRYHKTGQYLDKFCRAAYPLLFILFLIMYYFVFTEGRQDDCISRR